MKVELEKTFPLPATTEAAWAFLQNIEGVAGCMPGAKITERVDDTHYKGTISVRVGPAGMSFKGELEVQALDAATRTLHLVGKGSDTSGTSGASMDLVARIEPGAAEGTSNLVGRSEVTMSGKAAAFGGRMMGSVADQILKQFAGNFAAQVQARGAAGESASAGAAAGTASRGATSAEAAAGTAPTGATSAGAGAGTVSAGATQAGAAAGTASAGAARNATAMAAAGTANTTSAPAAHPATSTAASGASADRADVSPAADPQPSLAAAPLPSTTPPTSAPAPANELNALALFWAILRDWFRGLFRRKAA